jgi:carbonic anhydrase/acetyltransferase-like protein (isoleucine patch superfamily)
MAHLFPFEGKLPILGERVWLAPTATLIGHVTLEEDASMWFGAVARGDQMAIVVGARSNVQDNAVLHVTLNKPVAGPPDARGVPVGCRVGCDVTVGHSAIVHACTIGNGCLVGMGAIVLDGAEIGDDVIIAAGTLITPGTKIPAGSMVMGRPGKVVRTVEESDRFWSRDAAGLYVGYAKDYAKQGIGGRS